VEQKILRRTVLCAERPRDREQQFGRLACATGCAS